MKLRTILLSLALTFSIGCGGKSADDHAGKMVTIMEDLGSAIEGAGDDCAKMADGVEKVVKKYEGDLKEIKAATEKMKGDEKQAKEMMEKYGKRLEAAMPKLMGMMKCANDPKMKELQGKLDGMM